MHCTLYVLYDVQTVYMQYILFLSVSTLFLELQVPFLSIYVTVVTSPLHATVQWVLIVVPYVFELWLLYLDEFEQWVSNTNFYT